MTTASATMRPNRSRSATGTSSRAQYFLMFLVLVLTAGITVGREILLTLRFDTDFLTITLIAIVVSLLTAHRNLFFIVLMLGMTCAVNLPEEILTQYGVNKTILLATLLAMISEPLLKKFFD